MAEGLDVRVCAGLLAAELVAGEAEDAVVGGLVVLCKGEGDVHEVIAVLGFDLFVEGLETFVLGREATFRCGVHDEDDLAGKVGQRKWCSLLC